MNEDNTNPSPVSPNPEAQQPTQFDEAGNPIEAPKPKLNPNFVQKPIRTFESDLAEALAQKQGSVASIAIAENKRRDEQARRQAGLPPQQTQPVRAPLNRTAGVIPQGIPIPGMIEQVPTPPPSAPAMGPSTPFPTAAPIPTYTPTPKPVPPPPPQTPPSQEVTPVELKPRRSVLKPILFTLLSLVFIGGGIVIGIYIYEQQIQQQPVPITQTFVMPSLVPSDKQIHVIVGETKGNALIQKLYTEFNKIPADTNKITEFVLYETGGEVQGKRVTGSDFIAKFDMRIPDIIHRSLTDRFEFGAYTEETGEKTTFLALTTDFFQNAFAGMLTWEDTMPDDLALLLNYKAKAERRDPLATTTSYLGVRGQFSDKIIKNRDVRVFKKTNGELLFLYSFINKETLLITTTESAFVNIIERIEKDIYVR